MKHTSRIMAVLLVFAITVGVLSGCGLFQKEQVDEILVLSQSVESAIAAAGSVDASIFFSIQAHIGTAGTTGNHTASVESDVSVRSSFSPYTYYSETFSRILVDGVSTREDSEIYVVPADKGLDYIRYEYTAETDAWTQETMSLADVKALSLKTCVFQNWERFFRTARLDSDGVNCNNKTCNVYIGTVDSSVLQELLNDGLFGSFLTSVEHLLKDELNCIVYIEEETFLPVQIVINFADSFTVSDMIFDSASITVDYSDWGTSGEISVPKKVSVIASDPTAEFYASYYAWNLFLPYLQSAANDNPQNPGGNVSFTASWSTFQIRIDNGMTSLPILFTDLAKLAYSIDPSYQNIIIEPNMYVENIPVYKGRDFVVCTFYNDSTDPLPISSCKIGRFDIAASNQLENGISVYLPGEVRLGMSLDSLLAAYGTCDNIEHGFSCDTYTWRVEDNENQAFMAEISPVTKQVIRMQLTYIPVTGGRQ